MNLTGRKSVTGSDLQNLEELGITVTASEEATEALERIGSSWGADKVQFPYLWGGEQMGTKEFEQLTGHPVGYWCPDDLERANCPDAGTESHTFCGLCKKHGQPRFTGHGFCQQLVVRHDNYLIIMSHSFLFLDFLPLPVVHLKLYQN